MSSDDDKALIALNAELEAIVEPVNDVEKLILSVRHDVWKEWDISQPDALSDEQQAELETQIALKLARRTDVTLQAFERHVLEVQESGLYAEAKIPSEVVDGNAVKFVKPKNFWQWLNYVIDQEPKLKSYSATIRSLCSFQEAILNAGVDIQEIITAPPTVQHVLMPSIKQAISQKKESLIPELVKAAQSMPYRDFMQHAKDLGLKPSRQDGQIVFNQTEDRLIWISGDPDSIKALMLKLNRAAGVVFAQADTDALQNVLMELQDGI